MSQVNRIAIFAKGAEGYNPYFSIRIKDNLEQPFISYQHHDEILVIADVAGSFSNLQQMLLNFGVMDNRYKWTFGDGHLVILGNCLLNNETSVECLWLLYALEHKAIKNGGMLHLILGNEELNNMHGKWRSHHPKYVWKKDNTSRQYSILYDGNNELYRWLLTKNILERIGDLLFIQRATPLFQEKKNISLKAINESAKSAALKLPSSIGEYDWNENLVNHTLQSFKIKQIISGAKEVPHISFMNNGQLIQVHTTDKSEALLIRKDVYYRLTVNGEKEKLS